MKPTSIDLREQIMSAYDAGEGTRQQVADRFTYEGFEITSPAGNTPVLKLP
ncbi:MAG: hypothetical protein J7K65_00020 [Planctomycetes bacterium]|nr:hypothetical protein [Planctomycetota bacterium]